MERVVGCGRVRSRTLGDRGGVLTSVTNAGRANSSLTCSRTTCRTDANSKHPRQTIEMAGRKRRNSSLIASRKPVRWDAYAKRTTTISAKPQRVTALHTPGDLSKSAWKGTRSLPPARGGCVGRCMRSGRIGQSFARLIRKDGWKSVSGMG